MKQIIKDGVKWFLVSDEDAIKKEMEKLCDGNIVESELKAVETIKPAKIAKEKISPIKTVEDAMAAYKKLNEYDEETKIKVSASVKKCIEKYIEFVDKKEISPMEKLSMLAKNLGPFIKPVAQSLMKQRGFNSFAKYLKEGTSIEEDYKKVKETLIKRVK